MGAPEQRQHFFFLTSAAPTLVVGAWANVTSGRQAQTRIRQPSSYSAVNFLRSRTEEQKHKQDEGARGLRAENTDY
jgi:hypothetical protein